MFGQISSACAKLHSETTEFSLMFPDCVTSVGGEVTCYFTQCTAGQQQQQCLVRANNQQATLTHSAHEAECLQGFCVILLDIKPTPAETNRLSDVDQQ